MTDSLDMTGLWQGRYAYRNGAPPVAFNAVLGESGGRISGSISEPNTLGQLAPQLNAYVTGSRNGSAVVFEKQYDGAADAAHMVAYSGNLNEDGTRLIGEWKVDWLRGPFEMWRERANEAELLAEIEEVSLEYHR